MPEGRIAPLRIFDFDWTIYARRMSFLITEKGEVNVMAKRKVPFNVEAFWRNIQQETCKKKLEGALAYLEHVMKQGPATEEMYTCKMFLIGKTGKGNQAKLAAA